MKEIKPIVGANLKALRKFNNLSQLDVAERLNYSDKSVSKWERGDALPDIDVLNELCEMYGVTLDYLTQEHDDCEYVKSETTDNECKREKYNKSIIMLLSVTLVYIAATVAHVYAQLIGNINIWTIYLWAVPVSCVILIIFISLWGKPLFNYITISVLTWSLLTCFYIQFIKYNFWPIYFIGIPMQISILLWSGLKKRN